MFKCFRLNELVKNCLKDGGISLPFFVLNELCDTFKCARWVPQPRSRAPKRFSSCVSVADISKCSNTFGCARKL